ncbi:MAG: DUF1992 domain-containing protein [Acidimicrobiia bacterium]
MGDRKPLEFGWESWVERQIREAMERGEFDNLPGQGKPIPDLHLPYDELWWIRKKLREEKISHVPMSLAVRKELDEIMERIAAAGTEAEVRRHVEAINERIRYVNSHTTSGPPSDLVPLDVERVLDFWRTRRSAPGGPPG